MKREEEERKKWGTKIEGKGEDNNDFDQQHVTCPGSQCGRAGCLPFKQEKWKMKAKSDRTLWRHPIICQTNSGWNNFLCRWWLLVLVSRTLLILRNCSYFCSTHCMVLWISALWFRIQLGPTWSGSCLDHPLFTSHLPRHVSVSFQPCRCEFIHLRFLFITYLFNLSRM